MLFCFLVRRNTWGEEQSGVDNPCRELKTNWVLTVIPPQYRLSGRKLRRIPATSALASDQCTDTSQKLCQNTTTTVMHRHNFFETRHKLKSQKCLRSIVDDLKAKVEPNNEINDSWDDGKIYIILCLYWLPCT